VALNTVTLTESPATSTNAALNTTELPTLPTKVALKTVTLTESPAIPTNAVLNPTT
jgi:hypothetical protein